MERTKGGFSVKAIIAMVTIPAVVIGILIVAVYSLTWTPPEEPYEIDALNIQVNAYADTDRIEVKLKEGQVNWSDYLVQANGFNLTTSNTISNKEETAIFTGIPLGKGTEFNLKSIKPKENMVVWYSTVIPE